MRFKKPAGTSLGDDLGLAQAETTFPRIPSAEKFWVQQTQRFGGWEDSFVAVRC